MDTFDKVVLDPRLDMGEENEMMDDEKEKEDIDLGATEEFTEEDEYGPIDDIDNEPEIEDTEEDLM